jgi:type II secretory pathway component PulF
MNSDAADNASPPALADFILLNEEIAALVRARIPLEPNLARIGSEMPGKSGELAQRIGRRMQAGESLAAAMNAECPSMPAAYRAAVAAGIESGQLGKALEAIVETANRNDQLRHVTALALLYPLILVAVICPLLTIMVATVVPNFSWLNQSRFRPIEWLASEPIFAVMLAIGIPALVFIVAAIWWWRSGRLGGASKARLLPWLSGASRVHRWSQATQFAETLLLLVERGLPLDESLRLAGEASNDRALQNSAQAMAQRIEQGNEAKSTTFPQPRPRPSGLPVLISLALCHASDRNLLTVSLRQAAGLYRDRAIRAAEWYAEYLPILLTIVIGGTFTIGFTLFVFWPYASMLHEISGWNWK